MHALLLVLLLASSCSTLPLKHGKASHPLPTAVPQVARVEDVNILAYGVLQFRQALHDMYRSTTNKLVSIRNIAGLFDTTLGTLKKETLEIKEKTEELHNTVEKLKMEEKDMRTRSTEINNLLNSVLSGHVMLGNHVKNLEEVLKQIERGSATDEDQYLAALKVHIEQQNETLEGLKILVQHQQKVMSEQMLQLAQLDDQVEVDGSNP